MKKHHKPLSRYFPAYHPKAGEPTYFVEKVLNGLISNFPKSDLQPLIDFELNPLIDNELNFDVDEPKHHTIRQGNNVKVGDQMRFFVWSGKPRRSKQIIVTPYFEVKKVWDFEIEIDEDYVCISIDGSVFFEKNESFEVNLKPLTVLAQNDGLSVNDLLAWFDKPFKGQIICWSSEVEY